MDATRSFSITRIPGTSEEDLVPAEEPLEVRVGERPLAVIMRTPGDDFDLATGFLLTESVVHAAGDIADIRHWGSPNVVRVALRDGLSVDWQRLQRHVYASSSCGVCGKASIDSLRIATARLDDESPLDSSVLGTLPDKLRAAQRAFDVTGSIHAAGAFTPDGTLVCAREDVGRHNAVDKVIGSLARNGGSGAVMAVSGRASFEVVQKCVVARIPALIAVGGPTSLAVELAREFNLTLAGFVRDGRMNIYSGGERVV